MDQLNFEKTYKGIRINANLINNIIILLEASYENKNASENSIISISKMADDRAIDIYKTVNEFEKSINSKNDEIKEIVIEYKSKSEDNVSIKINKSGSVYYSGYGDKQKVSYLLNKIANAFENYIDERSWLSNVLSYSGLLYKIISRGVVFVSLMLIASIFLYSYAKENAVDIVLDKTYLNKGNEKFIEISDAIQSNDINIKLNVLLAQHLNGFINKKDAIVLYKYWTKIFSIILIFFVLTILFIKRYRKISPKCEFYFSHLIKKYDKYDNERRFWLGAVLVALIVNLAAGIIIAFIV